MNSASSQDTNQLTETNCIFYTHNEYTETEIKNTVLFTTASKMMKYLAIHLTKCVQDRYVENYKILIRDIKEA